MRAGCVSAAVELELRIGTRPRGVCRTIFSIPPGFSICSGCSGRSLEVALSLPAASDADANAVPHAQEVWKLGWRY